MHLLKNVHISINIALLLLLLQPTANVEMQLTRVALTHVHLSRRPLHVSFLLKENSRKGGY